MQYIFTNSIFLQTNIFLQIHEQITIFFQIYIYVDYTCVLMLYIIVFNDHVE